MAWLAASDKINICRKTGIRSRKIIDLISKSAMNNFLFKLKRNMYSKEEFPAAFMLELMYKDLGLIEAE